MTSVIYDIRVCGEIFLCRLTRHAVVYPADWVDTPHGVTSVWGGRVSRSWCGISVLFSCSRLWLVLWGYCGRLPEAVNKRRSLSLSPHSQSSHLSNVRSPSVSPPLPYFPTALNNKENHSLTHCSHWHVFTLLRVMVCVQSYVCVLAASHKHTHTHTNIMCISSYSQANPPPIIVNADSLDAGPYVRHCSCSLSQFTFISTKKMSVLIH